MSIQDEINEAHRVKSGVTLCPRHARQIIKQGHYPHSECDRSQWINGLGKQILCSIASHDPQTMVVLESWNLKEPEDT